MSIAEILALHKTGFRAGPGRPGTADAERTGAVPDGVVAGAERTGLVVSVIGSGGKTTLVWLLARSFRHERVLVSTTVKMRPPLPGQCDFFPEPRAFAGAKAAPAGITFAAVLAADRTKAAAPPLAALKARRTHFDKLFLEADGARERPYKGWAAHEPLVPEWTDLTIAVLPANGRGCLICEDTVHRLPEFCALAGAAPGGRLGPEHLAALISHPEGLLAKARGAVVLFFNQAESAAARRMAKETVALLPDHCLARLWKIIAGSARQNTGSVLFSTREALW